jgi:Na+/H+-dicarboxylate symporter
MKPLLAFFLCAVMGIGLALVQEHASKLVYRTTLALSAVMFLAVGWFYF